MLLFLKRFLLVNKCLYQSLTNDVISITKNPNKPINNIPAPETFTTVLNSSFVGFLVTDNTLPHSMKNDVNLTFHNFQPFNCCCSSLSIAITGFIYQFINLFNKFNAQFIFNFFLFTVARFFCLTKNL